MVFIFPSIHPGKGLAILAGKYEVVNLIFIVQSKRLRLGALPCFS